MDKMKVNNSESLTGTAIAGASLVLLVEDHADNRKLMENILQMHNISVKTSANGEEALTFIAKNSSQIGLIISDLSMPKMDGVELLSRIDDYYENVMRTVKPPVLALSAHAAKSDRERSLNAGFKEHLTKPVQVDLLVNTINQYLKPNLVKKAKSTNSDRKSTIIH